MVPAFSHSFMYVESDVPPDMTLAEWRHRRAQADAPRRRRTLHPLRRVSH